MPDGPGLDARDSALVSLSAALATRDPLAVEAALRRAARTADPLGAEEVLLQSHLFIGFPAALEAMILWRRISGRAPPLAADEGELLWEERGARVCAAVYGSSYAKLRANVAALHPDLDRWMVVGGYGRVIGRAGLDLATRELCIAALLVVWDAPRQLHSHLRGALNAGARPDAVERAVEIACDYADAGSAARARALWSEVKSRKLEVGES